MFNIIALIVILAGVALGHIPNFKMNRTTIAFVGATFLVAIGFIPFEEAIKSINLNTIVLLFSMMIINANFSVSGFFRLAASKILYFVNSPKKLLLSVILMSGFLSAVLLNDIVVLMLSPIIIQLLNTIKRNPIPYLIALGLSANIGSAMTPIGNPQNMLIAGFSGISFLSFVRPLFFVSSISLLVVYIVILVIYHNEFKNIKFGIYKVENVKVYRPLLVKSIIAVCVMFVLFLLNVDVVMATLISASILLVTRRIKPEKVFREVDWSLLVFFASLFVITGSIAYNKIDKDLFYIFEGTIFQNYLYFSAFVVILSNIVSNVPAVMILSPFIQHMGNPEQYWILTAMSSTFAGNLTILGSVANIIVVEMARKNGIYISFMEFFKSGVIVTLFTVLIGSLWLRLY